MNKQPQKRLPLAMDDKDKALVDMWKKPISNEESGQVSVDEIALGGDHIDVVANAIEGPCRTFAQNPTA